MTPYWPSPLGATRRRLAPRKEVQTFLFATEFFRSEDPRRRFPKPNRGVTWVADVELPPTSDFDLGSDRASPEMS